jgi:3'-phosphoadenosine 5'-phosphosulfate sulfotransferase (PAPS reductase)/FAD synthetase
VIKLSNPKHTNEDLKEMQSWPLERKIMVTQTRILEWYHHYNGMVYVSFSGGKDSCVLLDLARRIFPEIPAVFIDTGLEFPEIRQFVKTFDNVTWVRPKMTFTQVIEDYGYPVIGKEVAHAVEYALKTRTKSSEYYLQKFAGTLTYNGKKSIFNLEKWAFLLNADFKISDRCCDIMKKTPVKKYNRETGRKAIIATLAKESRLRKQHWLRDGCNSFNSKEPKSHPMSFWTENDVLEYIVKFNIPYASVYGDIVQKCNQKPPSKLKIQLANKHKYKLHLYTTGYQRTGCMGCLFGCHLEKEPNRLQLLKLTHPKVYDYLMTRLNYKHVCDFLGIKY